MGELELLDFITKNLSPNSDNIGSILKAMTDSMNKDDDKAVLAKLGVMVSLKDTYGTSLATGATLGITSKLLDNISKHDNKSKYKDYDSLTGAVAKLDPNWQKNPDGSSNIKTAASNPAIVKLANKSVLNKQDTHTTYNGTHSTVINSAASTLIVNKMSKAMMAM